MTVPYTKGLHQLTEHCHAWLAPDGRWGLSNAGLVTGEGQSLLVDTLFDVALTRDMLTGMRPVTEARPIRAVINTHANGDHWFGNELVADAEIIASRQTADEMAANGPGLLLSLIRQDGPAGDFCRHIFAPFDFTTITPTPASRTYDRELDLDVGGTRVRVINLGPAHTAGDSVVLVPSEGVLYAGDLLFIGGTPISWAGPISNWILACEFMLGCGADVFVPGHGPVTGTDGIEAVLDYLHWIKYEATERHARGMTARDAARDIDLGRFATLSERGRIAQNVLCVYHELDPTLPRADPREVFRRMAELEGWS